MEVERETSPPVIENLVRALEQATLMAKQIPTNQTHLQDIHTALLSAHHHLSLFLYPTPQPENSVSSAVGGDAGGGEPMQMGDDDDVQDPKEATVEKVEERMRDCFIQSKRPKRQLSPSAAAEQQRSYDNVAAAAAEEFEFDPIGTKMRALDLIYQFHA